MIVIDGVDGAGKGVQSRRLLQSLTDAGLATILTREPGGSPSAEDIRALLVTGEPDKWDSMTELLLMYAARRAHLRDTVWPALAAGKWVICDRFTDATYAYQGGGRGIGYDRISILENWVQGDLRPDLTIILDLSIEVGLSRANSRSEPARAK